MVIRKGMVITHKLTGVKCKVVDRVNSHNYVIERNGKHCSVSINTLLLAYDIPQDSSTSVLWLVPIIILTGFMAWYHNNF